MKKYKEFNFSLYSKISEVSFLSEEMYEVNGTSERFTKGFLTASCLLFSVTLFVNIAMLRVCYKREQTFMNQLVAFDCLVSVAKYLRLCYNLD